MSDQYDQLLNRDFSKVNLPNSKDYSPQRLAQMFLSQGPSLMRAYTTLIIKEQEETEEFRRF